MSLNYDAAVIGGGAAGMVAAIRAAERGRKIILFEKSDRPGRKIMASGNGRCNLMNNGEPRYFGDTGFALSVLNRVPPPELTRFFRTYGLLTAEEEDLRVYPITYQSASVLSVLKNALSLRGVTVALNSPVETLSRTTDGFEVHAVAGSSCRCSRVIVACGGAAQPKLGGSSDGYLLLRAMGHSIVQPFPSLVPLITDSKSISGLSGIRIRCSVSLMQDQNVLHTEKGEVLFTDYGVSGICIMQCARFAVFTDCILLLNLAKDVFRNRQDFRNELVRRQQLFSVCSPVWLLNGIFPEKVAYAVLKQAGIPLRGETAGETSREKLEKIMDTAYGYRISVMGNKGFDMAQVTAGGADCSQFDPSTLESRIVPGLFAAGEVLNVDGDCGGFNLMFAFSSGLLAGNAV